MKAITLLLVALGMICVADTQVAGQETTENMKIEITSGNIVLTANLFDIPTSRDLLSMLPITTELEDYAQSELIFYPDRKLTSKGAPDGYEPARGDITYYAPWGDVAIFYKAFRYSQGLIPLGTLENEDVEKLKALSGSEITIRQAAE